MAEINIEDLLKKVIAMDASDLHLEVGKPPCLRINGQLYVAGEEYSPLSSEDTERFMRSVTDEIRQQKLEEIGSADFGFPFEDVGRFRVNVFKQKGGVGLVFRLIPAEFLPIEKIGLPPDIKELLYLPRGLVIVTGPTGSGKSTTLATMINIINSERQCHIITIEDPIEFYHPHKKAIVVQREVGVDVRSFSDAVVQSLRQDPDVILVGEMRDYATIEAAVVAAETGHLVFGTLHTNGAVNTIDRMIDVFPVAQQDQIRVQISMSLQAVISQQLLLKADGQGRVAAFEIMRALPSVRNLIRERKTHLILSSIQTGYKYGMRTMDQALVELYQRDLISYDDMIEKCYHPGEVEEKLKNFQREVQNGSPPGVPPGSPQGPPQVG
jgi:twitching motility protein PilT